MIRQLQKYLNKMERDGATGPGRAAILVREEQLLEGGAEDLLILGRPLFIQPGITALVVAEPRLPVHNLCFTGLPPDVEKLVPLDTETRTFLHDIPLIRVKDGRISTAAIMAQLSRRKGVLVEGVGIVAIGAVTVEQAYVNYSSVYHALFVSYLLRLLQEPPQCDEMANLWPLLKHLGTPIPVRVQDLSAGPFRCTPDCLNALEEIGQRTLDLHLVDSFFGNVSCHPDKQVLISQTGASLDELAGCIDLVPDDDSSTAGLTASSELAAHRAIYHSTGAGVVLHGHPKFSVILSLLCDQQNCGITDCWKDCPQVRYLNSVPVVAGEVGAGGIAETLPPVMSGGIGIVYGHGVFATGLADFRQPLAAMIELENWCRKEYLQRLERQIEHCKDRSIG